MSEHHHIDPNPVRPSQAEGDDDDDDIVDDIEQETSARDPKSNRPSQAEGEDD